MMAESVKKAGLWSLFATFTKIGAFTIGGGYAMIPLIEAEVVSRRGWIASEEFLDMLVVAQSAPGLLAMNISVLVGNRLRGRLGAVVSALGSALPSFVIILVVAAFFGVVRDNVYVDKAFRAVRPAVVALIAVPILNLSKSARITWRTVWIPVLVAALVWLVGFSPIYIIPIAGVCGILVKLALRQWRCSKRGQNNSEAKR